MTQTISTHPIAGTNEDAYWLAVEFVAELDERLDNNSIHLYDCNGRLMTTLDQVLAAITEKRWPVVSERIMHDESYRANSIFDTVEAGTIPEPAVF